MNELKENFSRLYFSPDEVNQELAISMKSLITKEDFIDILVDRYVWYLKERVPMTKKYAKYIKYFEDLFRYYCTFSNLYRGEFEAVVNLFEKTNCTKKLFPELHYFGKMTNVYSFTTLDFVNFDTKNIARIPYPSINKFYRSCEILHRW
jgi:hypothetical protein